jgi:hypothetical protein
MFAHDYKTPRLLQAMLGFQRQLNDVTGFDADLVYQNGSREDTRRDPNLFYDPETGLFKDPRKFGRPRRDFGVIGLYDSDGYSDYMALASSLTRRFRNNFQVTVNYTLMFFKREAVGTQLSPFDISLDWGRASDFQRYTVNANGIWSLPAGIQLAGTFHYGSGNYSTITAPVQALGTGPRRVRADLSVIPLNTFKEDPWQSLNIRVVQGFPTVRRRPSDRHGGGVQRVQLRQVCSKPDRWSRAVRATHKRRESTSDRTVGV